MEQTQENFAAFANGEPLTIPHFDEEATVLAARPVEPLAPEDVRIAGARTSRGSNAWRTTVSPLLAKRSPLLALIILGAIGIVSGSPLANAAKFS